jgi:hypothetical protein
MPEVGKVNSRATGDDGTTWEGGDWEAQVLAWARTEVGCRADDTTCDPVLWCRACGADLAPGQVRRARLDGRLRYVCARCGGPVRPTPF